MAFRSAIGDVHRRLLAKELTANQLCESSLRIAKQTSYLNAFITLDEDGARAKAQQCDQILSSLSPNSNVNRLIGVPIAIKDNFCSKNLLTSCGSRMLSSYIPPYDATIVDRLCNQANAVMIGKSNLDEFAMGSSSTTSYYGPTANPWKSFGQKHFKAPSDCSTITGATQETISPDSADPDYLNASSWYMSGGSSSGSAAAVATGSCLAAIGTDTGGSNRHPASMVGIVGFKPSYGMISRFGMIPLAHSLDTVSIMARYVTDIELVFNVIAGVDQNDLTTRQFDDANYDLSDSDSNRVITIGIPKQIGESVDLEDEVFRLWQDVANQLSHIGRYRVIQVSMPHIKYASHCYAILNCCEVTSNMACYDGVKYGLSEVARQVVNSPDIKFVRDESYRITRDMGFGDEVKKRILLGNYFLHGENRPKYYDQALRLRRMIADDFERVFTSDKVDVLLTPSTPNPSISNLEWNQKRDDNLLFHEDSCLIPANLANTPAINLPAGTAESGMPMCLQLVGRQNCDRKLLSMASQIESLLDYNNFLEFTG